MNFNLPSFSNHHIQLTDARTVVALFPIVAVLLLWISSLFNASVSNVLYKVHLLRVGITHLLFSSDKKWKTVQDAGGLRSDDAKRTKKIVFVRHGESAWNVVFNKGFGPSFVPRLFSALFAELNLSTTMDSVFVDSPLSALGAEQALSLQSFVENEEDDDQLLNVLRGAPGANTSVLASSNLRRALSTGTIGFWKRIRRTQEKIKILSSLQEITFNIDGVALAKPQTSPVLSKVELSALHLETIVPERYFDCAENQGDKPVRSRGIDRINTFAAWAMDRDEDYVIAAGHSLYFRFFFQSFLPKSSTFVGKVEKMANGSVVAFTLEEGRLPDGTLSYKILEESVDARHGGFENKKGGKKKSK